MAAPRTVKWRSPRPAKAPLPAEAGSSRTVQDFSLRPLRKAESQDNRTRSPATTALPSGTPHSAAAEKATDSYPLGNHSTQGSGSSSADKPAPMTIALAPRRELSQLDSSSWAGAGADNSSSADNTAKASAGPQAPGTDESRAPAPLLETPGAAEPGAELPEPESPPSPPPPPQAPSEDPSHGPSLFRSRALPGQLEAERATSSLDALDGPTTSWWTTILFLLTVLIALIAAAAFASVETTAEAQGALRAPNGLRPVSSSLAAPVTEVLVQPGQAVTLGQVIIRQESADLTARLERLKAEVSTLQTAHTEAEARDTQSNERASAAIKRQRVALQSQIAVGQQRQRQRQEQARALATLVQAGGASQQELLQATERVQSAKDAVSSLLAQLAALDLELADRERRLQEREAERLSQRQGVEQSIQETRALLRQTQVKAPASGIVESLVVTPGSVTKPGEVLAQIVPSHTPRQVVAFLASREASFLEVGSKAKIELESLPESEFGAIHARVTRLSRDVASEQEVAQTLGAPLPGPVVRVELQLIDAENSAALLPHLRSGERVVARLHRRDRRVLGLFFDFVRDWTDP